MNTPTLIASDAKSGVREYIPGFGGPTDNATLSSLGPKTSADNSDAPAPAVAAPVMSPALPVATPQTAAPVEPSFSNVASLTAPDPQKPLRVSESKGEHLSLQAHGRARFADRIASLKERWAEVGAFKDDCLARGVVSLEHAQAMIKREESKIPTITSLDGLETVTARIAHLKGITAATCQQSGRLLHEMVDPIRVDCLAFLVDDIAPWLQDELTESELEETVWFSSFGLPREETGISRRVRVLLNKLAMAREPLDVSKHTEPHQMIRHGNPWSRNPIASIEMILGKL